MEWEKKFYDIVRETESNLESARRKLRGHDTVKKTSCAFSQNTKNSFSYSSNTFDSNLLSPVPLTEHRSLTTTNNNSEQSSSLRLRCSVKPASPRLSSSDALFPSASGGDMRDMQSKIASQSTMIERLERLVRTLSQEKEQYRKQIRDLQSEVGNISTRLGDNRLAGDAHLETQVDLMRHEVRRDMQRLQQLISNTKASNMQSGSLERSFRDMQNSVHSDLEELRRDLHSMMHRVGKLELDTSAHNTSQRDLRDYLSGSSSSAILGKSSSHNSNQSSVVKPADVFQVKELRSTVSELHHKLNSLEQRLTTSYSSPRGSTSKRSVRTSAHSISGLSRLSSRLYRSAQTVSFDELNLDDDDDDIDDDVSINLDEDDENNNSELEDLDLDGDLDLGLDDVGDDDDDVLSEDLEEIIRASRSRSSVTPKLSSSAVHTMLSPRKDLLGKVSSLLSQGGGSLEETGLISDLDLDLENLGLDSASADLDSLDGSLDLTLDDL